jgi:hypothetical protein
MIPGDRGFIHILMWHAPEKHGTIGPNPANRIDHIASFHFTKKRGDHHKGKQEEHQRNEYHECVYTKNGLPDFADSFHYRSRI